MSRWRTLPLILAIALAASYIVLGILAAARFPHAYGPWQNNTLSQLGNRNLNPDGYVPYLLGCGISGVFAIAFFLSLGRWRLSGTRNQNRLLLLVQALGVAGGFGLFMTAIFPENQYDQHHFWAGLLFNSFAAAVLIAIPALRRGGHSSWGGLSTSSLIVFNIAAFVAVIVMFVFAPIHWIEWVPGAMFLFFPILLGIRTRTLA